MIDKTKALELLREVVQERGESYVYPRDKDTEGYCQYAWDRGTEDEQPGCIVGAVFYKATGELVPVRLEGALASSPEFEKWFDSGARSVLRAAQTKQDQGQSWGFALQAAEGIAKFA